MTDIKLLLQKACSSRMKHAFSALVEIRKNFMKSDNDVHLLLEGKLVERILGILKTRHSLDEQYKVKVTDISVSILSNLCMEAAARKRVLQENGVSVIVALFGEVESQKLQNRVCRCLANLLLDPGCWKLVCSSSVIEKIVKLLEDTDNEEIKLTCIRAIRLLGQTSSNVAKLLEKNALSAVLKLIDCEVETVKQSAFRSVHSLATHGCTTNFSSQVLGSGKLLYILQLVEEWNKNAFQLIGLFLDHHSFRAEFGNYGGIKLYHDHFLSAEGDQESWKTELLNGICLCCKEVVNRVKIREANILPTLLQSLKSDRFGMLSARIISALVCFLYDESSFTILLDNGLVDILVRHLEKSFHEVETKTPTSHLRTKNDGIPVSGVVQDSSENTGLEVSSKLDIHSAEGVSDNSQETKESEKSNEQVMKKPVYRIDSPTYRMDIKWELDETNVVKCKTSFTPPHVSMCVNSRGEYSPLSVNSYYSPSTGSPQYSPPASPISVESECGVKYYSGTVLDNREKDPKTDCKSQMTGPQSPESYHQKYPKYTGISCQLYQSESSSMSEKRETLFVTSPSCSSDVTNIKPSDELSPGAVSSSDNTFDDVEDPFDIKKSPRCTELLNLDQVVLDQKIGCERDNFEMKNVKDPYRQCLTLKKVRDTKDEIHEEFKKHLQQIETQCLQHIPTNCKHKYKENISDCNVLVLLSRASQMTDPSIHLVQINVVTCLLDYMTKMEAPLSRCPRILSRVFRNPLCFERTLELNIPLLIHQKLLRNKNIPFLNDLFKHQKRRSFTLSKAESPNDGDFDRFSTSDDDHFEDVQAPKRRRLSLSAEEPKTTTTWRGTTKRSDEKVCDTGRSGFAFLEDLCGIADSSFGRGTFDRIFRAADVTQRLQMSINMLFLTWTQSSQKHYLFGTEILDHVLDVLQASPTFSEENYRCVINGIRFLAQVTDTRSKYQESIKTHVPLVLADRHLEKNTAVDDTSDENLKKEICNEPLGHESCEMQHVDVDTFFEINNHKIPASRAVLSEKSAIFAAMLTGSFSEAHLSDIPLPASCRESFECLVHYLHGCKRETCTVVGKVFPLIVTGDETAVNCLELLNECDKYNVPELSKMAYSYLCDICITPGAAFLIFKYAVIRRDEGIMKACVSCILYDCETVEATMVQCCKILLSEYSTVFIRTVYEILIE